MWYWYITVFIAGGLLGLIGMAILAYGARADDRTKMMRMRKILAKAYMGLSPEILNEIEEFLKNA